MASTHLICPSPVGDKYMGALKWGLPAVTAAWLLACAEEGRRVSEKNFLVGETKGRFIMSFGLGNTLAYNVIWQSRWVLNVSMNL